MKKINTTPITTGSAMPFKSGSLEHLQSAYQETLIDIVQTFEARNDTEGFPNYTTPVIMYGCRRTGLGVSQGVVAYGTELYRAQAVNITLGFGEVVVGTITTTYFTGTNADPVTFSDSTNNNVHEIREIVWSAGISGSGDFDFDNCLIVVGCIIFVLVVIVLHNIDLYVDSVLLYYFFHYLQYHLILLGLLVLIIHHHIQQIR